MTKPQAETHPVMLALSEAQRQQVLACGEYQQFVCGDWLSQQHLAANQLHLLLSGRVQLMTMGRLGRNVILESLGPGDMLGWSWFTNPEQWHFSARAATDVHCFSCHGETLRKTMDEDPALGYAILTQLVAMLAQRVQAARLHSLDVYALPVGGGS